MKEGYSDERDGYDYDTSGLVPHYASRDGIRTSRTENLSFEG